MVYYTAFPSVDLLIAIYIIHKHIGSLFSFFFVVVFSVRSHMVAYLPLYFLLLLNIVHVVITVSHSHVANHILVNFNNLLINNNLLSHHFIVPVRYPPFFFLLCMQLNVCYSGSYLLSSVITFSPFTQTNNVNTHSYLY